MSEPTRSVIPITLRGMALLLDSALVADARQAASFGFIHGATINPTLMAKDEARRMAAIHPDRIGLKIPCTLENLSLAAR